MKVRGREREYHPSDVSALRHAGMEYEIAVAPARQPRLDNTELARVLLLMTDSRTGIETDTESRCRA